MVTSLLDTPWIWHPTWTDHANDSAGAFVHFRRSLSIDRVPAEPVGLQISADTRYRLYVNGNLVHAGPVKGDSHIWFYDEVDIAPFLMAGVNNVGVHVLRLYHGTPYGTSFPRMAFPGLFVRPTSAAGRDELRLTGGDAWFAALDTSRKLRIDQKEDDFLHVYEDVNKSTGLEWVPAKVLDLPISHGIGPPWNLTPRMIPVPKTTRVSLKAVHNVQSSLPQEAWETILINTTRDDNSSAVSIRLPACSSHRVELEAHHHLTANLRFRFERPSDAGSRLRVTYAECYEDPPDFVPYVRCKGDRRDRTKALHGPADEYAFAGQSGAESAASLQYIAKPQQEETFTPFHYRTFRFLALDFHVGDTDLVMTGLDVDTTNYPLEVTGQIATPDPFHASLWATSLRTLTNCMHDCYEDCPFYEQLQYAMDVRSSCLFTYSVSGDDRMARQAIIQLHSSYRADAGLIASRSPASQRQVIPHFSLFWVLTVLDHFEHFGDVKFTRRFLPVCHGILDSFARRIDPEMGLISSETQFWDFVDWSRPWRPMGVPKAADTGYQTFTNMLYAHTAQRLILVLDAVGRPGVAQDLKGQVESIVAAVRQHCRVSGDGVFTDGLAKAADLDRDLSQHSQIWAVLCGAATGDEARRVLSACLPVLKTAKTGPSSHNSPGETPEQSFPASAFTKPSMAMSFYVFRALSQAGGTLYDDAFHNMWDPWRDQLSKNLTTWCEDDVTQRSDCHAWSCAPLYEFMAEVAGVRPAEPGWGSLVFKPRTKLLGRFDGRVPLAGKLRPGTAHVSWRASEGSEAVSVTLTLETAAGAGAVPILVTFPDNREEIHVGPKLTLEF